MTTHKIQELIDEHKEDMKILELFSGTGSITKVCKELDYKVVSVDLEKKFKPDICIDILKWDYKKDFKEGDFDIITSSPVCLYWSIMRNCWIGRKFKNSNEIVSKETLQRDINKFGKPMVDKVFEIIDYFKPKYFWIENPKTSKMWNYIKEKHLKEDTFFYHFDYCKYSNWGYKKPTIFYTNIKGINPLVCKNDCENIIKDTKKHSKECGSRDYYKNKKTGKIIPVENKEKRKKYKDDKDWFKLTKKNKDWKSVGHTTSKYERYRIPPKLIKKIIQKLNE